MRYACNIFVDSLTGKKMSGKALLPPSLKDTKIFFLYG